MYYFLNLTNTLNAVFSEMVHFSNKYHFPKIYILKKYLKGINNIAVQNTLYIKAKNKQIFVIITQKESYFPKFKYNYPKKKKM